MIPTLSKLNEYWTRRRARLTISTQNVGNTESGKDFLGWLRRHVCKMDHSCFVDGDPYKTSFLLGRQSVWLEIQAELSADVSLELRTSERLDRQQESILAEFEGEAI